MTTEPTVFVVDDDQSVREALCWLLRVVNLKTEAYASTHEYLAACDPDRPGCLVLDVRMPEISGLQLQEMLAEHGFDIPVIMITGHGDVPMAVRAMKAGAVDFIQKPFNDQVLLERIQHALALDARRRQARAARRTARARLAMLSRREYEVLNLLVSGKPNKVIAAELGISVKTVEVHRSRAMAKMGAKSVAELATLRITAGAVGAWPPAAV
jgi:FixJ family two-component response regulator